tara:strand:+ start:3095 stop:3265 length:171 start_codon:yes stop_codon:yes gene_type:complete
MICCGIELDYETNEYAKYGGSDCEEIISIYSCSSCKKWYSKRDGNFDLEDAEYYRE